MHVEYTPILPVLDYSAYINLQHVTLCRCSMCFQQISVQEPVGVVQWAFFQVSVRWTDCVSSVVILPLSFKKKKELIRPVVFLQLWFIFRVWVFHGYAPRQDGGNVVTHRLSLSLLLLLFLHLLQLDACRENTGLSEMFLNWHSPN